MDSTDNVKREIEQLIGLSDSDSEMFWSLSKKCAAYALAPAIAFGVRLGPGFMAAGTVLLPGVGTISGATATVLTMGGMWGASWGACMAILPGLMRFRDQLRRDPLTLHSVRLDVGRLLAMSRREARAGAS